MDIGSNLVEFFAEKNTSSEVIWINRWLKDYCDGELHDKDKFKEKFSYQISNGLTFSNISFDKNDRKILYAERYGGFGLGRNGGGARCGNDNIYQIKGVGKNILAEASASHWHAYGGLNLVDAIFETINSQVYGSLLPLGAAKVYGIILTGKDSAFLPGVDENGQVGLRGCGALLVREACIRPAHFLRCTGFEVVENLKDTMSTDVARLRKVTKNLSLNFKNQRDFTAQLGKWISNYANQFAFSKAARIAHGSLSPSNLCLDGRWLDLTSSSFLVGGRNQGGDIPFLEEPKIILTIIKEMVETYAKYNRIYLSPAPLTHYYWTQFEAYFSRYASYAFGFDLSDILSCETSAAYQVLSSALNRAISSSKEVFCDRCSILDKNDPILALIDGLFLSLFDKAAADKKFISIPEKLIDRNNIELLCNSFSIVLIKIFEQSRPTYESYFNFIIKIYLKAHKRLFNASFYYMGRLESYIYDVVKYKRGNYSQIIEEAVAVSQWAFDIESYKSIGSEVENKVVIFFSKKLEVYFDAYSGQYVVVDGSSNDVAEFHAMDLLLQYLSEKFKDAFLIGDFDFYDFFISAVTAVSLMETNASNVVR